MGELMLAAVWTVGDSVHELWGHSWGELAVVCPGLFKRQFPISASFDSLHILQSRSVHGVCSNTFSLLIISHTTTNRSTFNPIHFSPDQKV